MRASGHGRCSPLHQRRLQAHYIPGMDESRRTYGWARRGPSTQAARPRGNPPTYHRRGLLPDYCDRWCPARPAPGGLAAAARASGGGLFEGSRVNAPGGAMARRMAPPRTPARRARQGDPGHQRRSAARRAPIRRYVGRVGLSTRDRAAQRPQREGSAGSAAGTGRPRQQFHYYR